MTRPSITMQPRKKIALVAHDHKKRDLLEWIEFNKGLLCKHELYATGTTGRMVEKLLGIPVTKFQSGPLGGISRSAPRSPKGSSTSWCFSGIPWNPPPTIPM